MLRILCLSTFLQRCRGRLTRLRCRGVDFLIVVAKVALFMRPVAMAEVRREGRRANITDFVDETAPLSRAAILYLCGELPRYGDGVNVICMAIPLGGGSKRCGIERGDIELGGIELVDIERVDIERKGLTSSTSLGDLEM